jgi:hypothetical protein
MQYKKRRKMCTTRWILTAILQLTAAQQRFLSMWHACWHLGPSCAFQTQGKVHVFWEGHKNWQNSCQYSSSGTHFSPFFILHSLLFLYCRPLSQNCNCIETVINFWKTNPFFINKIKNLRQISEKKITINGL